MSNTIWCLVRPSRKVLENQRHLDYMREKLVCIDKLEAMQMKLSGEWEVDDISDLIEDDEELEYMITEEV